MQMIITAVFPLQEITKSMIEWNTDLLRDQYNELIRYFASNPSTATITDFKTDNEIFLYEIKPYTVHEAAELVKNAPYAFINDETCRRHIEYQPENFFIEIKSDKESITISGTELNM